MALPCKCGTVSDDPRADLAAYAGVYLQREVVAQGAIRNVPAFSRFLHVAALANGTIVNFTNLASGAQVRRTTVFENFDILKDTLVLHELPEWPEAETAGVVQVLSFRCRSGGESSGPEVPPRHARLRRAA